MIRTPPRQVPLFIGNRFLLGEAYPAKVGSTEAYESCLWDSSQLGVVPLSAGNELKAREPRHSDNAGLPCCS